MTWKGVRNAFLVLLVLSAVAQSRRAPASSAPRRSPPVDPDNDPDRYPTPEELEEWKRTGKIPGVP